MNYPLKFSPILQEKIWGGSKLITELNKQSDSKAVGESWEISAVEGFESVVSNGSLKGISLPQLIEEFKTKLVGKTIYEQFGNKFPLLIKFIDAKADLSVQLHPNDELAKARHNSFGKTEMWYIMNATKEARLNIGFKQTINKAEYLQALENKQLVDVLHFEPITEGDSFFIRPGKVHAIGAGTLLAEIQQTSDITYRIYDWDRLDNQGNSRELHTELALDAIDFEKKNDYKLNYQPVINQSVTVGKCRYFTTSFLQVEREISKNYHSIDSFIIYMCVGGKLTVSAGEGSETIQRGETILLPAAIKEVQIKGDGKLLEIWV